MPSALFLLQSHASRTLTGAGASWVEQARIVHIRVHRLLAVVAAVAAGGDAAGGLQVPMEVYYPEKPSILDFAPRGRMPKWRVGVHGPSRDPYLCPVPKTMAGDSSTYDQPTQREQANRSVARGWWRYRWSSNRQNQQLAFAGDEDDDGTHTGTFDRLEDLRSFLPWVWSQDRWRMESQDGRARSSADHQSRMERDKGTWHVNGACRVS